MKTSVFLVSLALGCFSVTATPARTYAGMEREEEVYQQLPAETEELEEYMAEENEGEMDEELFQEMEEAMQSVDIQYKLAVIQHGDTVAFQPLYNKLYFLGCPGNKCDRKTCPRLYMEGKDWHNCWGEVFQIYRKEGPGEVRVGDTVGIFYPRESKWLSLAGGVGHKASCPGHVNKHYGFYSYDKWQKCWGEVFEIYARGKAQKAVINEHDHITLYYRRDNKWVGLVNENPVDLRTCPGTVCPPLDHIYDHCWGEVFELWKKPH